ncbi:5021_t:CDS:10 [Ambispora leptoticha]|uniref:5021_t:CDS:1 n=1 Tax=Ambispora leptoticha TaxID=144679 RepID=A0A9N8ZLM6_9GLOM|nr:5021_t:CDS:10 [Ambispora leptoticha]
MDFSAAHQQIEEACDDMQVPATRLAGEQVLLSFKQASGNLEACKYILVDSKMCMILSLANYAREQLLHAISVITKRSLDDYYDEEKQAILRQVQELVNSTGYSQQIGIGLANALTDEFSTIKSSNVGVTWNFHKKSKDFFEANILLPFFEIVLRVLHQRLQLYTVKENGTKTNSHRPDPRDDTLLAISVALAEKILTWDFSGPNDTVLAGTFIKEENDCMLPEDELFMTARTRAFPPHWRSILLNSDVLQMFFTLLKAVQESEMLAHRTRQCLIQLSGLRIEIFENETQIKEYMSIIIRGIMSFINDLSVDLPERSASSEYGPRLLGVTQMIRRFLCTIPLDILCSNSEIYSFLQEVAQLTAICLRETATDKDGLGYLVEESTWSMEAFDELLAIWVKLVQDVQNYINPNPYSTHEIDLTRVQMSSFNPAGIMGFLTEASYHITATYIDTRIEMAKFSIFEEDDYGGYKDWDTYGDQLMSIAILGRVVGQKALERLHGLLHERYSRLKTFFHSGVAIDGSNNYLNSLHETTNWLILISGFMLTDSGESETLLVPDALMKLSISQSNLGKNRDQVVMLSKTIIEILELFSLDASTVEASHCSPRVAETLFWFLERWAKTYLLIDETYYSSMSQNLIAAFGKPTSQGVGIQILEMIIELTKRNFVLWNADVDPLLQIVRMLNSFAKEPALRNGLLQSEKFIPLITFFTDSLNSLPEMIHNILVQTITIIISGASDPDLRLNYFEILAQAIEKRLLNALQRPDFDQKYQQAEVMSDIMSALEMFDGLALASSISNSAMVFSFCAKYFESFVRILQYYQNCPEVIVLVLQFFKSFVSHIEFSQLTTEQTQLVYKTIGEIFKVYSEANLGKNMSKLIEEGNEEPYSDISTLLGLLTELIATDLHGFSKPDSAQDTSGSLNVPNIVFYGINQLVPLLNREMLKIPRMCGGYIRLVSNGYQAITPLALFVHNGERKENSLAVQHLYPFLDKFLQIILECLLFKDFEASLIDPAAESLVALICARRNFYNSLVSSIIAQQAPDIRNHLQEAFYNLSISVPETLPESVLRPRDVSVLLNGSPERPNTTSPSSSQPCLVLPNLNMRIPIPAKITTPPTTAPEIINVFVLLPLLDDDDDDLPWPPAVGLVPSPFAGVDVSKDVLVLVIVTIVGIFDPAFDVGAKLGV